MSDCCTKSSLKRTPHWASASVRVHCHCGLEDCGALEAKAGTSRGHKTRYAAIMSAPSGGTRARWTRPVDRLVPPQSRSATVVAWPCYVRRRQSKSDERRPPAPVAVRTPQSRCRARTSLSDLYIRAKKKTPVRGTHARRVGRGFSLPRRRKQRVEGRKRRRRRWESSDRAH